MTFQEANKNSSNLFSRNNLSRKQVEERLCEYFSVRDVLSIIHDCKIVKSWTDGNIVVLYFKQDETYTIVARGRYIELIEP